MTTDEKTSSDNQKNLQKKDLEEGKKLEEKLRTIFQDPTISESVKAGLYERYEQLKKANRAMEFADKLSVLCDVSQQLHKHESRQKKGVISSLKTKLTETSKKTRIVLTSLIAWTAYVSFRTSNDHQFLGLDLEVWSSDYFFLNWLGIPVLLYAASQANRWIKAGSP